MSCRRFLIGLIFFALVSPLVLAATKSDTSKEKRWKEQIVPSLLVGKAVTLKAEGSPFLALYAQNTYKQTYGGAILIHGMGANPALPQVIEPLGTYLPLMPEAPLRIKAGVDYLKNKGITNITIVVHSLGSTMADIYLANKPDPVVYGYVAIGMSNPFPKKYDNAKALMKINMPVLDIYGEQDLDIELGFAKQRATAARQVNKHYTQIMVLGADHFFTDMQDNLLKHVRGWLMKNVSGVKQSLPM